MLGSTCTTAAYLTLSLVTQSGLEAGDIKLAAVLATATAYLSWPTLLASQLLSWTVLAASTNLGRARELPAEPALLLGAFLTMTAGLELSTPS
ncbi:hypothetical protein [Actinokineospora bangkokensis]|uniref:Prepilin type IV endopeptidase peptidase domain-containing protein n=1 Tax=Actinokineospora bangkokensis TaxID=1193682 RepID=A0A1Q9LR58_9PSEU|nr:hypothetical protein [Actinokineospora bangkokensis]OLR94493.1 hypothetical protein BJP25_12155 [Actinokineospora bangkokensis]